MGLQWLCCCREWVGWYLIVVLLSGVGGSIFNSCVVVESWWEGIGVQ